ncbi:hypothetical protein O181_054828 [Austropuccinia psidii MF-1]|uniref:Uncharacterized protein n=1 Tax=Austropuccinia psidii MF-1 TaxID=1389203 RepID=A0A9Q3EA12_9BASI|nr:hypothetical protein [Austropuccinia psidii MF-1]
MFQPKAHLAPDNKGTAPRQSTQIHIYGSYYESLLQFIHSRREVPIQSLYVRPYAISKGPILLCRCVLKQSYYDANGLKLTTMKPHNNQISYVLITGILEFDQHLGHQDWALVINPIQSFHAKDLNSPTQTFQLLCYMVKIIVGQILDNHLFIHPNEIG